MYKKFVLLLTLVLFVQIAHGASSNLSETPKEKIFIVSAGFDEFLVDINKFGRHGYRLIQSKSSDGNGLSRKVAGIMKYDKGGSYSYEWLVSQNRNLLESGLNQKAREGFVFNNSFAITGCSDTFSSSPIENDNAAIMGRLNVQKGDLILMEKKNEDQSSTSEYRLFHAKIGLGRSPTKQLQESLNNLPGGFYPKTILFSKAGLTDFTISVLVEKKSNNAEKVEYQFIREVRGFEKEVNRLAKQGYEFVGGRRVGLTKMALMAKNGSIATNYIFTDKEKYERDFAKTISAGNRFHTLSSGDVDCDSGLGVNEKFVFSQNTSSQKFDYKFVVADDTIKADRIGEPENDADQWINAGYKPVNFFFHKRLIIILEK